MAFRFSEDAIVYPLSLLNGSAGATGNLNVRNNNVQTAWFSMAEFDRIFAYVQCDHATWNGADGVTTLKLQQAKDSSGTGAKDLTTSGAGSNYNTTNDTLTASDSKAILECRAEDMDTGNGFYYARLYAASTGNTGADNLFGFAVAYNAVHQKKQLQGAYSAATLVYVTPQAASS
jgi:hypothetical protein